MRTNGTDTRIPIFESLEEGQTANAAVVRYRRKKWPAIPREEGFFFLRSDGDKAEEAAIVRAEFWARVTLPIRYRDAVDVRISLERREGGPA